MNFHAMAGQKIWPTLLPDTGRPLEKTGLVNITEYHTDSFLSRIYSASRIANLPREKRAHVVKNIEITISGVADL